MTMKYITAFFDGMAELCWSAIRAALLACVITASVTITASLCLQQLSNFRKHVGWMDIFQPIEVVEKGDK